MRHPLDNVPREYRKQFFFSFLFLTLILFAVFRILDQPLRTSAAPNGIVSFELARTPEKAFQIMVSWESVRNTGDLYVAFGLGFDYLFMPMYAFALAFGTLLTAGKHSGWLGLLGAVAGYGAFVAAAFDAVENYALFQILLGAYDSTYPMIAAVCASIKFGLLFFGLVVAILGGLMPGKK
jgi:hypothetical protein